MIAGKKKALFVLTVAVVALSMHMTAFAAPISDETSLVIQPCWVNVTSVTASLTINNGKAVLSAFVNGVDGVTKITANAVLERRNTNGTYSRVAQWSNINSSSKRLTWSGTRYVTKGYTYRFTISAKVYKNGVTESISGSRSAAS